MKHALLALIVMTSTAVAGETVAEHPEMWMFDTRPITSARPIKSRDSFSVNDRIYARVFFDKPLREVIPDGSDEASLQVWDEHGLALVLIRLTDEQCENPWLDLEILPDPSTARSVYPFERTFHAAFIPGVASPGQRRVWFKLNGIHGADARQAFIAVDFAGGDAKKLQADADATRAAGRRAITGVTVLPERGRLHGPALAKLAERQVKRMDRVTAARVIVTSDEWYVERHAITGAILGRNAEAGVVGKSSETGTCELRMTIVRQDYVRGRFRAARVLDTAGSSQPIDCAKAFTR